MSSGSEFLYLDQMEEHVARRSDHWNMEEEVNGVKRPWGNIERSRWSSYRMLNGLFGQPNLADIIIDVSNEHFSEQIVILG